MTHTTTPRASRTLVRRAGLALLGSAAIATLSPLAAHAAGPIGPVLVPPGSSICIKDTAFTGAHSQGLATNQGAGFTVFRNGVVIYLTTDRTSGFALDSIGGGTYKICATNNNTTNTKVTLTLTVS